MKARKNIDSENGLRKYNRLKQSVELRPKNPGKKITDNLPGLVIDPDTLDMYSDVSPIPELPGCMSSKAMLAMKIEIPKWRKRKKLYSYGWGVSRGILEMDIGQLFRKRPAGRKEQAPTTTLKKEIRDYAKSMGFICGFTKIDRRFIADCEDGKFPFDTAVVLGMEMDKKLLDEVPRPGRKLFDFEVYVESGKKVFEVGRFIKSLGYRCHARIPFDGWVKYPPHAIGAGLGELGASGVVITREFGPRVRWCMISVNADIEPDEPRNLNMDSYCDACRICIKACPGGAIPEEKIWWRGVQKRKINDTKCWPYFVGYEGCGVCLKVCPVNRYGYKECMEAFENGGKILGVKKKERKESRSNENIMTSRSEMKDNKIA